ncbi:MAG: hypothetical protein Q9182_004950 [Xanthomendoza sp. 2 TL-2023]
MFHGWSLIDILSIDGFRQLWEGIQDMALDSDAFRDRLSSASAIFKYPPLSTESAAATFLRACAIQNFLSTTTISIIRRRYFAEPTAAVERKSGTQPIDSILDTISNIPAATSSQELSWRLTTVGRLDRLGSHDPSAPTEISLNLVRRASSMKSWVYFTIFKARPINDYVPSLQSNWQQRAFVEGGTTNGSIAANSPSEIPVAQLPSKSFILFPRITGFFEPDRASPHILHAGSALPNDSPAFRKGLQEIKHIEYATEEFKRSLRRGSIAQSSPVTGKRQGDWHVPHPGYH